MIRSKSKAGGKELVKQMCDCKATITSLSGADRIVDIYKVLAACWHAQVVVGTGEPAIALHIKGVVGGSWDACELPHLAAAPIICRGSGSHAQGTQRGMRAMLGLGAKLAQKTPAPCVHRSLQKAILAADKGVRPLHASFALASRRTKVVDVCYVCRTV